jgi:hypothetical protein
MCSFANDFLFITFNAISVLDKRVLLERNIMGEISTETARQIVVDFVKKKKMTERIEVSIVEQKDGCWVVRGTCPIDLEGHPWAEKFEVVVDSKGKIKSTDFALL